MNRTPEILSTQIHHDLAAERGVIGCCLWSKEAAVEVIGTLNAIDFYDSEMRRVWESICLAVSEGLEFNPHSIATIAHARFRFGADRVAAEVELLKLQDEVPSAANVTYYSGIVREQSRMRNLVGTAQRIIDQSYTAADANQYIGEAAQRILDATRDDAIAGARPVKVFTANLTTELEAEFTGKANGILTGIHHFDRMTGGLKPGDLVIVAGRPGAGKTAIALSMVARMLDDGVPIGFFSLEMTGCSLVRRMVAAKARRNMKDVRNWVEGDFKGVSTALAHINSRPLYIEDTGGLTIDQVRSESHRMRDKRGIKCIVVDYLQKIHAKSHSREREVSIVSDGLKCLAKELQIPIIALAQINRSAEKEDRRPRLSDLRESGGIEQDADIVGLLWRPKADTEKEDAPSTEVDLVIAKQRDGQIGTVPLIFFREHTRFEERTNLYE